MHGVMPEMHLQDQSGVHSGVTKPKFIVEGDSYSNSSSLKPHPKPTAPSKLLCQDVSNAKVGHAAT